MKKKIIFLTALLLLLQLHLSHAAVISVTPASDSDCSDLDCDLQSALDLASNNLQDDTINIAAGTYNLSETLNYIPTAENYALTINGAGVDLTIIDIGSNNLTLNFNTTNLADDLNAPMVFDNFSMQGAGAFVITSNTQDISATICFTETLLVTLSTMESSASIIVGQPDCIDNTIINEPTSGIIGTLPGDIGGGNLDGIIATPGDVIITTSISIVDMENENVILSNGSSLTDPNYLISDIVLTSTGTLLLVPVEADTEVSNGTFQLVELEPLVADATPGSTVITTVNSEITNIVNSDSHLRRFSNIDPDTIEDVIGKPDNLIFGLFDIEVAVDNPGDPATVTINLPEPAPAGYVWYKYSPVDGWYSFMYDGETGAEIDGSTVTLHFIDGGRGDDDGIANGIIADPSGLGEGASSDSNTNYKSGCFIATAAYGSFMEPHVKILRNFRDRFLITNSIGNSFVQSYYKYSPPVADFIAKHGVLRAMVRWSLLPLVCMSWSLLNFGPLATLIFMLLLTASLITFLRHRQQSK